MNFTWWFSVKIAFGKNKKNNLSGTIIKIGQLAVIIGIVVSLITISTGVGARKAIKEKLADFNGHITIKPYSSNLSLNSDSVSLKQPFYPKFKSVPSIEHIQAVAYKSGIIRTKENFSGVVFKGVGLDYDTVRFEKFLVAGHFPKLHKEELSDEVVLSEKIADELKLKIGDSFVMYFMQNNGKPIYRRFTISGLYKTDIKNFDDIYLIGDLKHVQRLNKWSENTVGGFELFASNIEDLKQTANQVNKKISYQFYAKSASESFAQINDWIKIFDKNILIILVIMLFVVVINMVMVLMILILERTHSIGILKAFGATNWQIRKIFVNYSLFIMLPGLLIGNLIGLGFLYIQKYFGIIKLPPENYYISVAPVYLSLDYIIALNVGALIICGIVLIIPSYLITKISPAKAIRFS